MKTLLLTTISFIFLSSYVNAESRWHKILIGTQVAFVAGSTIDAISSHGLIEQNPALGQSQQFGAKQVGIKFAITGAILSTEYLLIHNHKEREKVFAIMNIGATGLYAGTSIHNYKQKP